MTVLMRALNLSNDFITWTSTSPDYEGTYAPESIQSDTAVIVADTGGDSGGLIQKLGLEYNPVGLWLFDGNLNDSSGNDFNLSGSPEYTTTEIDKQVGAIFGTSAWARPSRDAALAITGAVTIEAVISLNFAGLGMGICVVGANSSSSTDNIAYFALIGSSGEIIMSWETGSSVSQSVSSATGVRAIPQGIPSHLVYTRSAGETANVNLYVNGINVGSGSRTAATGSTSTGCLLRVGTNSAGLNPIDKGTVFTSLKIIAAELTPQQVVDEYNRVLGGKAITYPVM